jgi:hypothetical protein
MRWDVVGVVLLGLLLLVVSGLGLVGILPVFYAWGRSMREFYERSRGE